MKRSEMVKYIETELKDIVMENYIDEQGEAWCAELILKKIEEAGMVPPVHYPYSCGCPMRGQCPSCSPDEYKMYNKWEPEDV